MRDVKYRWNPYSPFDFQGVEAHLSAMAARGWRLEKTGSTLWKYRRRAPAQVRCAVTCPPEGETSDRLFFQDLCASAGWEKAADWAQMQIYTSERERPTPLETDPGLFLERVHRSMKAGYLRDHLGQMAFAAFWVLRAGWGRPRSFFLSQLSIGMFLTALLLLLLHGSCAAGYWLWHRRSLRSVEEGGDLVSVPGWFRALSRVYNVWIFLLLPPVLLELACGTPRGMRTGAQALLGTLAAVGLVLGANWYLKGRTMSREGQTVLALVCVFVLALPFIEWDSCSGPAPQTPGPDEYLWEGRIWDREPREIPLTVEDLTGRAWPHVRRDAVLQERSFFGSRTVYSEVAGQENGETASLYYGCCDVSNTWVYGLLLEDLLDVGEGFSCQPEDPAPWNANAAYQRYWDGEPTGDWLICWPGRMVELRWEGAGQITAAAARLAPEGRKEETR